MAKNAKKNKKADVEAFEDEEFEEDDDAEAEEDDDDEPEAEEEEDDDDDDEDEPVDQGFSPFVISEDQEWTLESIIEGTDVGEPVYLYLPPEDAKSVAKWYVLRPVTIGEVEVKK